MARWLTVLAALAEDPGSTTGTQVAANTVDVSNARRPDTLFWPLQNQEHTR